MTRFKQMDQLEKCSFLFQIRIDAQDLFSGRQIEFVVCVLSVRVEVEVSSLTASHVVAVEVFQLQVQFLLKLKRRAVCLTDASYAFY